MATGAITVALAALVASCEAGTTSDPRAGVASDTSSPPTAPPPTTASTMLADRPMIRAEPVTEFVRRWANRRPYGELVDPTFNALAWDELDGFRRSGAKEVGSDIGWDVGISDCSTTEGVTDTCGVLLVSPNESDEAVDSPSVWVTFACFDASDGLTSCAAEPDSFCTTDQQIADPGLICSIVVEMSRRQPEDT